MANEPLYVIGHESYRIRRNNAKYWPLCCSGSFKVTDFGTNRKPICNLLLVINTKLPYLLSCTVFKLWPIMGRIFASDKGVLHFNAFAGGDSLQISGQTLLNNNNNNNTLLLTLGNFTPEGIK